MTREHPDAGLIDRELLVLGGIDYLDVWSVHNVVRRLAPEAPEAEIMDISLAAIERLLRAGRIQAGDLYPPGEFSVWPFDLDEAVSTIRDRCSRLRRPLQPGDIEWFEVLEDGDPKN